MYKRGKHLSCVSTERERDKYGCRRRLKPLREHYSTSFNLIVEEEATRVIRNIGFMCDYKRAQKQDHSASPSCVSQRKASFRSNQAPRRLMRSCLVVLGDTSMRDLDCARFLALS